MNTNGNTMNNIDNIKVGSLIVGILGQYSLTHIELVLKVYPNKIKCLILTKCSNNKTFLQIKYCDKNYYKVYKDNITIYPKDFNIFI